MAKTIKEERLRWVLPIAEKRIRLVDAAKVCPYSKRSLERWLAAYKKHGEAALKPKSTEPKTYRAETPIWLKEIIIGIRRKTKKCALKIFWQLEKQDIVINARTIGKILKKEGLTRKYRVKRIKYKYIKTERQPGELVEIDVKYVPGTVQGKEYYQYTAIDVASRWRHMEIFEEQSNYHSIKFLKIVMDKFPHRIQAIKTDNHSTFTNFYTGTNKRSDMTQKNHSSFRCFLSTKQHYSLLDR